MPHHHDDETVVVAPFYDQQRQLDLMIEALARQTLRPERVVIADDGSPCPPVASSVALPVEVVSQDDRGIRPAAARNLGVDHLAGIGSSLVFLDSDTVPTDTYLEQLTSPLRAGRADVVVGYRRHAWLAGCDDATVRRILAGAAPEAMLPEPSWLADGYAATNDLRDGSHGVWRYVIGAVMACTREQFERIGGFDPTIDTYGAEDWDFAYRAWVDGARFEHVRDAVAVHDGPRHEDRPVDLRRSAAEAVALARRIADPSMRGPGVIHRHHDGAVELRVGGDLFANVMAVETLLGGTWSDIDLFLVGDSAAVAEVAAHAAADPRVRLGPADPSPIARWVLRLDRPMAIGPSGLARIVSPVAENRVPGRRLMFEGAPIGNCVSSRAAAMARRGWCPSSPSPSVDVAPHGWAEPGTDLAAWFRGDHPPSQTEHASSVDPLEE